MCERGDFLFFPPLRSVREDVYVFAAHPCLLSSSGSCPVELERGAQLLSAGEGFILRGREKTQTPISAPKNCVTFRPLGEHNISAFARKTKTADKQDTGGIFDKGIV